MARCTKCGYFSRVLKTVTELPKGRIRRRCECLKCGLRFTHLQPVRSIPERNPPLSAAQASRVERRAHKSALASRYAKPTAATVSLYPVALDGDLIELLRRN